MSVCKLDHARDAPDDGPTSIVWAYVASVCAARLSAAAPGRTAAIGQQSQSQPEEQHPLAYDTCAPRHTYRRRTPTVRAPRYRAVNTPSGHMHRPPCMCYQAGVRHNGESDRSLLPSCAGVSGMIDHPCHAFRRDPDHAHHSDPFAGRSSQNGSPLPRSRAAAACDWLCSVTDRPCHGPKQR